jgi:hypothetical protein
MLDSEHVLDKLGKLVDYGNNLSVRGKGRRHESMYMTIYQSIDFGGTFET